MFFRRIWLMILAFLLLTGCGAEKQTLENQVVQVLAGSISGNGVIYGQYSEKLIVVTAAHILVEKPEEIWVVFADGWAVQCSEYEVWMDMDGAWISISSSLIPQEHFKKYACVEMNKESLDGLAEGDLLQLVTGNPKNEDQITEGVVLDPWIYIEDFSQHMLLAKLSAMQGMSGGGVFDSAGHFVGILCGGTMEGEAAVLPGSVIEAKYRELLLFTKVLESKD